MQQMNNDILFEIKDLSVRFDSAHEIVKAVNGISYSVRNKETFAIVGESGSGKTVSMMAVMRLLASPPAVIEAKAITFNGTDLQHVPKKEWWRFSGEKIAMIFQDAITSLNPVYTVGWQIAEMFRIHREMDRAEIKHRTVDLLKRVGIPEPQQRIHDYPHQFSGGMRQRAMIAMGIALNPNLLIADEPTTALDVTVQAQIMDLLQDLKNEKGMSLILITHDLGVVAETADRVAIMYAGTIVETGSIEDVLGNPLHPYTLGLLGSRPQAQTTGGKLKPIFGSPPNLAFIPQGCAFHPRCQHAEAICRELAPTTIEVSTGHHVTCHTIK
jgi:oligopeptide transport system ATP-binding protein